MLPYQTTSEAASALGRNLTFAETLWFNYSASKSDYILYCHNILFLFLIFSVVPLPLVFVEVLRWAGFDRYKIQPKVRLTLHDMLRCYKDVMWMFFSIVGPLQLVSYPSIQLIGIRTGLPLPSGWEMVSQLLVYFLVEDYTNYWIHRFLHNKWGYDKIHRVHHEYTAPIGFAHLWSSVPSLDGDRITNPSESAAADTLQPSVMVAASNGSEGSHSVFGKSASENVDIFSGLECLDDCLTQTTSGAVPASRKSPDKVNGEKCGAPTHCSVESSAFLVCDVAEAQTISDYCATQDPVSCTEAAMSIEHGEIQLETKEIEALDVVFEAPISTGCHAGKFQPKLRVKKGKENPNIPHPEVESTILSQPAHFETGDMDESSFCAFPPGDVHNHVSPTFGDSIAPNPTPNFQVNAESFAETTKLDEAVYGDAVYSEGICAGSHNSGIGKASTVSNRPQSQKRKGSAADEAKDGTSARKSRKRFPHQQVDDSGNNTNEDSFNAENSSDYDGNEDGEHNTERRKKAPRKSKVPVSENEKPVQKRKRTKKAPDEPTKEPTKKKFSHSTRRNRRHVDKSLLEIPEDEIDPQKVPMKDLIRLREYRERVEIKEAAKLKTPASDQSANDEFHMEASHNEENFGFEHMSSDENQVHYRDRVSTSYCSFNYQSFMKKQRPAKWYEQDTELFYEGIEQFGSDFSMIALLFPGRTRDQIKFKFKKEVRHNPLRINEAFRRQSKDNSKYVLVINELQKGAGEKLESNADESSDMAGQEEVELTHDNNREVAKPELDKIEDMETDVAAAEVQHEEPAVAQVHSPMKSDQSDDGDGFGGWDDDF